LTPAHIPRVMARLMAEQLTEKLTDEARLALAYTGPILRDALRIFFEFDGRLARIVSATNEPMLGQMRLAWWRDTLGTPVNERPEGDMVLDALGAHWAGQEAALVALVDGWEWMLSEPPLSREAAEGFAKGRAHALGALANFLSDDANVQPHLQNAGMIWALADAASHIAEESERATLLEIARDLPSPEPLPSPYRGVAVLGALGVRSIAAGGAPLMAGRGAALVAFRAGLLGR
ncbi:MAG: squalene/phytoene synthase family protein, partial [Pseudomonadota bacterium]